MRMSSYFFLTASLAGAALGGYYVSVLLAGGQPPVQFKLIDSKKAKELQEKHQPRFGSHPEYLAAIAELKEIWAKKGKEDQVSTDKEDLETHGISDWSYHEAKVPTVVVWAESTEDVVEVVKIAQKYRVPITPFSGGTSLEGHFSSVSSLYRPLILSPPTESGVGLSSSLTAVYHSTSPSWTRSSAYPNPMET